MDKEAQKYLDAITSKNKEITINIKIIDSEKAKKLLGTMYGKNTNIFGVEVTNWGFYDTTKASVNKLDAIGLEINAAYQKINNIIASNPKEFLME